MPMTTVANDINPLSSTAGVSVATSEMISQRIWDDGGETSMYYHGIRSNHHGIISSQTHGVLHLMPEGSMQSIPVEHRLRSGDPQEAPLGLDGFAVSERVIFLFALVPPDCSYIRKVLNAHAVGGGIKITRSYTAIKM